MKKTVKAYGKLNLSLDITGKLPNGYHTVETVMQAISLHDDVTVTYPDGDADPIALTCSAPHVPCDESNLVWRAAQRFFDAAEQKNPDFRRVPVQMHIEKHIPVCAGMAGGSSVARAGSTAAAARRVRLIIRPPFYPAPPSRASLKRVLTSSHGGLFL